jgi:microcystin-dependent protein
VFIHAGGTPAGFITCNGAAVSRSTYSALFNAIGTSYGGGNGSTTFNVPDMRNRFPIGSDLSYGLASTGGYADAVLVSHNHSTDSVGSHAHNYGFAQGSNGAIGNGYNGIFNVQNTGNVAELEQSGGNDGQRLAAFAAATSYAGEHSHAITTRGENAVNRNIPPYLSLRYIIKY